MISLPSAGDLLRAYGTPNKRTFGQHFLVDPSILGRIVEKSGVSAGDHVLEIGPGPGTLTRTLLAAGCRVTAVEIDRDADAFLRSNLAHPALSVICGDALELDIETLLPTPTAVVANLPYNAATEIYFRLEAHPHTTTMTLMFQREVARRFVAECGTKNYGLLALMSAVRWERRLVLSLPPGSFLPPPRVHSAAVRFDRRTQPGVSAEVEPTFRKLARAAFQKRRKTMRNALSGLVTSDQLEVAEIDPSTRPERVGFEGFAGLAEIVWRGGGGVDPSPQPSPRGEGVGNGADPSPQPSPRGEGAGTERK